jgi:hypothetical protein
MVALKEPHLAELGWHDESQPEQGSGGHNDYAPVQRASICRPALLGLLGRFAPNFVSSYRT